MHDNRTNNKNKYDLVHRINPSKCGFQLPPQRFDPPTTKKVKKQILNFDYFSKTNFFFFYFALIS